jgi:hypothetical protein
MSQAKNAMIAKEINPISELRVLGALGARIPCNFSHARQSFLHSNAKDAKTGGMNSFAGTQKNSQLDG